MRANEFKSLVEKVAKANNVILALGISMKELKQVNEEEYNRWVEVVSKAYSPKILKNFIEKGSVNYYFDLSDEKTKSIAYNSKCEKIMYHNDDWNSNLTTEKDFDFWANLIKKEEFKCIK